MGNSMPIFMPCCDFNLPSSRAGIEDYYGLSSTGPIKIERKKFSIATSETISILPVQNGTNRSSVTEFIVSGCESIINKNSKTPEKRQKFNSLPCSPGKYTPNSLYRKGDAKNSKNIVKEVRSKSNTRSPDQIKIFTNVFGKPASINFISAEYKASSIGKRRGITFEPLKIDKIVRKKLY